MGKLDDMAKELYEDDRVFADTINVLFFDGEQRIQAQDLSPLDTTEEHTIFDDEFISVTEINENADKPQSKAEAYSNQKYRDAVRLLQTQNGSLEVRIIVGAELQSHIHYAMPIRNFEYDAINLSRQLSARQKYNRENHLLKTQNEFLSGIKKGETFTPVLTVVVYFGKDAWDAPETLHEMLNLDGVPLTMRKYVPNYHTALLQPSDVSPAQLTRMKSPLRHILGVIKASSNWQDMNDYVEQNQEDLSHMDSLTAGIISEACNMSIPKQEFEMGDVNMCNALVEMKAIARSEGEAKGKIEGELKGKVLAYLECGKSDEWIMDHLQISQEKLDEIRDNQ